MRDNSLFLLWPPPQQNHNTLGTLGCSLTPYVRDLTRKDALRPPSAGVPGSAALSGKLPEAAIQGRACTVRAGQGGPGGVLCSPAAVHLAWARAHIAGAGVPRVWPTPHAHEGLCAARGAHQPRGQQPPREAPRPSRWRGWRAGGGRAVRRATHLPARRRGRRPTAAARVEFATRTSSNERADVRGDERGGDTCACACAVGPC